MVKKKDFEKLIEINNEFFGILLYNYDIKN